MRNPCFSSRRYLSLSVRVTDTSSPKCQGLCMVLILDAGLSTHRSQPLYYGLLLPSHQAGTRKVAPRYEHRFFFFFLNVFIKISQSAASPGGEPARPISAKCLSIHAMLLKQVEREIVKVRTDWNFFFPIEIWFACMHL